MLCNLKKAGFLLILGLTGSFSISSALASPEFSADVHRKSPKGETVNGKMYVSRERVRTEMSKDGNSMIHITDPSKNASWMIFPARKAYMERQGIGGAKPEADDPCSMLPEATCKKLGEEAIDGRSTVKWSVSMNVMGKQIDSVQWIDSERKIPLRQELGEGQVTEMRLAGTESLNGRAVEKWQITTSVEGKPVMQLNQWYDPALEMAIKEELPGGGLSELTNIVEGPQPDELYQVPSGYQKMTPPQGQAPMQR